MYIIFACLLFCTEMSVLKRVSKIAKSSYSFVVSVSLSAWNNSAPSGRGFTKFDI
jgi:hypothetical protein